MIIHEKPPSVFPFVRSEGTPFEVGRVHGEAFAEQVHRSIAVYRRRFDELGVPWERALPYAERAAVTLRELDPALATELDGIAAGADADPREIVAINIRTSVIRMIELASDEDRECTTTAVLPEATADGHTLLGQNWDQRGVCQENTVVIEQHIAGERAILFVTEAGVLFRHGMNDAGIGIAGNALRSDREGSADSGMPAPVARRRALRTSTLADARAVIEATPRAHSVNHLLADAAGAAIDLEAIPAKVFEVPPASGVVAHSNHFINEEAATSLKDRGRESADTLYRDCRVRDALGERRGSVTVEDVKNALKDHHGFPKSVCNHAEDIDAPNAGWTLASTVMDLTERRMWTAPGPACIGTYTEYAFS